MKNVIASLCLLLLLVTACSPAPTPSALLPTDLPATDTTAPTESPTESLSVDPVDAVTQAVSAATEQPSSTGENDAIATALADSPATVAPTITPIPTTIATATSAGVDIAATIMAQDGSEPLRIGVLPVLNALPLYVARTEGFYQDEGVAVDIITFSNAREREEAIQTGALDGETTDIVSVVLLNNAGFDLRAVRWDTTQTPFFSVLVTDNSNVQTLADLQGANIAIAENTIIDYMTWVLLQNAGLSEQEIQLVNAPSISSRIEGISNGAFTATTLQEPLTTLLTAQDARVIATDAQTAIAPMVIAFDTQTLIERGNDVRAFLRAYERAVEAINANPQSYRDLFIPSSGLPDALRDSYPVPTFRTAGVMNAEQFGTVITWMQQRNLVSEQPLYRNHVTDLFLPVTNMNP